MNVEEALEQAFDAYDKHAPWRGQQSADFLASLRANGFEIVPRKATEEMHRAARDWSIRYYGLGIGRDGSEGCWNAMIAAAQENDDGLV